MVLTNKRAAWEVRSISIFKAFLFGFILILTVFGMGYGLIFAVDVELILGTSSAFNVVRGTTVAGGASTIYVGSATVSINSNTQGAMLYIAGSSSANTDASLHIVNTSGTSTLYVRNDGNVGVGTNTPSTALYVIGTITATTGYIGDGSQLTGISATSLGANTVDSSQLVNTLNITDTTINVGSLTVSAGSFRVDSAGSMTATTITSTGSVTASTLAITGNVFNVDSAGSMTASTIKATGSVTASLIASTGTLTAANSAFVVDESGSMTAARISVSNLGTMTGGFLSVGTISANVSAHGTNTVRFLNNIFAKGTVTATGFTGDGSQLTNVPATVGADSVTSATIVDNTITGSDIANTLGMTDTTLNIGSLTVNTGNFRVDSAGSMTATTITSTGSVTASTMSITGTATLATTSGNVGIGTTSPGYKLEVNGSMRISSGSGGGLVFADGSTLSTFPSAGSSQWTTSGSNIYNNNLGNVGIGTTTPGTALHVIGTVTATKFIGDGSGLSGFVKIVKTADQNKVSDTTLADDDNLKFTVTANETWIFKITAFAFSLSGTPDIQIAMSAPSDASVIFGLDAYGTTSATIDDAVSSANTSSGSIPIGANEIKVIHINGTVINSTTPGTVVFQWAQNTSNAATVTVRLGSLLEANKI